MRRTRFSLTVMALFILGACGAGPQNPVASPSPAPGTPVAVLTLKRADIERDILYAGQVAPVQEQSVVPQMGGTVKEMFFDVGDVVKEDAVLFTVDDRDIRQSIEVLESQLQTARAGVSSAATAVSQASGGATQGQILQLQSAVDSARTARDNAQLALRNAQASFDRVSGLFATGDASNVEMENAQTGLEQAKLGAQQAENAYTQAQKSYDVFVGQTVGEGVARARDGLSQAQAGEEAVQVQLDNARSKLEDIETKSPISGVVSVNNVKVGGMVSQSSPAMTIVDISTVYIDTHVSEMVINTLNRGQQVGVAVRSLGQEFTGTITQISPAADARTGTYLVRIELPNPEEKLKPGMYAEVRFVKQSRQGILAVPRSAVLEADGVSYVMVAEGDQARRVEVQTGIDNGQEIEITSGLEEGMKIIVRGQQSATGAITIVSEG